jgi:hypothetical protein
MYIFSRVIRTEAPVSDLTSLFQRFPSASTESRTAGPRPGDDWLVSSWWIHGAVEPAETAWSRVRQAPSGQASWAVQLSRAWSKFSREPTTSSQVEHRVLFVAYPTGDVAGPRTLAAIASPSAALTGTLVDWVIRHLETRLPEAEHWSSKPDLRPEIVENWRLPVESVRYKSNVGHGLLLFDDPSEPPILSQLGIARLESVTIPLSNGTVSVYRDGELCLHDPDPEDVPRLLHEAVSIWEAPAAAGYVPAPVPI